MTLIDLMRAGIGTIFLLLASGGAQKPLGLTAKLIQIEGQVTISSPSESALPAVRLAVEELVIRRGDVLHLPTGAKAILICSTDIVMLLQGPQDWVLDEATCGLGVRATGSVPAPEGSYRNLVAFAGRIIPSKDGFPVIEDQSRYVNPGFGPFLLGSYDTAVRDARPLLVWTQVADARVYEIEIKGPVETSIRLAADDLHCGRGSGPWHDLDVCSWAPSGKWPALEPGKPVFLKFGSRQTVTAPLRQAQEVYKIHLLPVDQQLSLQENLRQIDTLPMDKASRLLLTAGTYAQGGLYGEAIATYDEALHAREIPEARVTVGDLYLTVGLPASADREYQRVLANASNPAAQAAAELGLGQIDYLGKVFSGARAHFERARELYTKLGLQAEAEEAQAAAARSGNDSP